MMRIHLYLLNLKRQYTFMIIAFAVLTHMLSCAAPNPRARSPQNNNPDTDTTGTTITASTRSDTYRALPGTVTDNDLRHLRIEDAVRIIDISGNSVTDDALGIIASTSQIRILALNNTMITD